MSEVRLPLFATFAAAALSLLAFGGSAAPLAPDFPIVNGSFELGIPLLSNCPPVGWAPYVYPGGFAQPGGTSCRSTERAHTGRASLRVDDPGNGVYTAAISSPVPAFAGEEFLASAWFSSPEGAQGFLFVQFLGAKPEAPETSGIIASVGSGATLGHAWSPLEVRAVAPPGTASALVNIFSCAACGGAFHADDASLTRVPGTPSP